MAGHVGNCEAFGHVHPQVVGPGQRSHKLDIDYR